MQLCTGRHAHQAILDRAHNSVLLESLAIGLDLARQE
mgnify:CR=1 FL=1